VVIAPAGAHEEGGFKTRSLAVASKADRTAYDVQYSCRTDRQNFRVWNGHGYMTTLTMAILDTEISAVRSSQIDKRTDDIVADH